MSKYAFKFILDGTTDITDKIKSFSIESSLDAFCRELSFDLLDEDFYDTLDFSIIPETARIEVFTSIETPVLTGNLFVLNFEGVDGATSGWEEEIFDLQPTYVEHVELDTDEYDDGTSSLKLVGTADQWAVLGYDFGTSPVNFVFSQGFRYTAGVTYFEVYIGGAGSYIDLYTWDNILYVYAEDRLGNTLIDEELSPPAPDVWHELKITVSGRDITIEINDIEVGSATASIDYPFNDLEEIYWGSQGNVGADSWIDKVYMSTTDIMEGTTVWVSQGLYFIERPTFKVGIHETMTGVWGRQSTAILAEPFAQKVTKLWDEDTTFYAICEEIIESVGLVWDSAKCEIQDFTIYADNFEADDQYPIEVLQELVELIVGEEGFVTSDREGNICIKRLVRTPTTSDYDLTDLIIQEINEEPEWPEFGNRIKIIPVESVSQNSISVKLGSECIGISTLQVGYVDVWAQVKNGEGVPLNDQVVTWSFDPVAPTTLSYVYPLIQNSKEILISKEIVRADSLVSLSTKFEASTIIGIWAYADVNRLNNFVEGDSYILDGTKVYLTEKNFSYCDQMVMVSYTVNGMVYNKIKYTPGALEYSGEVSIIASLSGKEDSKTIYVNNYCKCPSTLSAEINPTTLEIGEIATITAYLENGDEAVSGKIYMYEYTGLGIISASVLNTGSVTVTDEKAEAVNVIAGITQCISKAPVYSYCEVYTYTEDADGVITHTSANLAVGFSNKTINLGVMIPTGTNLVITYNRAGSVVNYFTAVTAGDVRITVSSPVNTEEGLSQVLSATINEAKEEAVEEPKTIDEVTGETSETYYVKGPSSIILQTSTYGCRTGATQTTIGGGSGGAGLPLCTQKFGSWTLHKTSDDSYVASDMSVDGTGIVVNGNNIECTIWKVKSQTFTVTLTGPKGVTATKQVTLSRTDSL